MSRPKKPKISFGYLLAYLRLNLLSPGVPALRQAPTLRVTREELINAIKSMKKSTRFGPDRVPAYFIPKFSKYLIDPILELFISSLSDGVFPKRQ